MSKVTIDEVRKAISRKINTFRDKGTTKIYSESIEQSFQEPCFYIRELRANQEKEISNRDRRGHFYDIHYFPNPNSETKNADIREMVEVLYDKMEYIEVSGRPLMGLDMNHRMIDGVLHFFVKYPMYLYKETAPIPKMESLEYEGGLIND